MVKEIEKMVEGVWRADMHQKWLEEYMGSVLHQSILCLVQNCVAGDRYRKADFVAPMALMKGAEGLAISDRCLQEAIVVGSAQPAGLPPQQLTLLSLQIFNDKLTKDEKKRIDTHNVPRSHSYYTLIGLLEHTKELHRVRYTSRGHLRKGVDRVLQAANTHAVIGDVFMQSQGQVAALAWGSIRLLIRVRLYFSSRIYLMLPPNRCRT